LTGSKQASFPFLRKEIVLSVTITDCHACAVRFWNTYSGTMVDLVKHNFY